MPRHFYEGLGNSVGVLNVLKCEAHGVFHRKETTLPLGMGSGVKGKGNSRKFYKRWKKPIKCWKSLPKLTELHVKINIGYLF